MLHAVHNSPLSILHSPFILSPAACGLHKDSPVDKIANCGSCGTYKIHPQRSVYDISRTNSRSPRVFPNFPRYYYYDKNLFYFLFRFPKKEEPS